MDRKSKEDIETKRLLDDGAKYDVASKLKGILSAVVMVVFIVLSSICVQLLQRSIPDLQLNAMRTMTSLVVFTAGIISTGNWPLVPKAEIAGVAAYSFFSFVNTVTSFVGVTLLPLATLECVIITLNISTGVVLFTLVLKEKLTFVTFIATALCITGVILVIQPDFIFTPEGNTTLECHYIPNCTTTQNIDSQVTNNTFWRILKYILPVVCGTGLTLVTIIVKKMPYLSNNMTTVLFWTLLSHLIVSVIVTVTLESPVLPSNALTAIYTIVHSVSFVFIWPAGIYAVKAISGTTFTLIYTIGVAMMLIAQYTVLSTILPGHRNWIEVVGVILVTMGSALCSLLELRRKRKDEIMTDE